MITTNKSGTLKQLVQEVESNWITALIGIDADVTAYNVINKKILTFSKPVLQYRYVIVFFNSVSQTSNIISYGKHIPMIIIPTNYFQNSRLESGVDEYFDSATPRRPYVRVDGPGVSYIDFYWPYEQGTHDENTVLYEKVSGNNTGRYEVVVLG